MFEQLPRKMFTIRNCKKCIDTYKNIFRLFMKIYFFEIFTISNKYSISCQNVTFLIYFLFIQYLKIIQICIYTLYYLL